MNREETPCSFRNSWKITFFPRCSSRIRARKTQVRLRQMLEILNRVEAVTGSTLAAYAWFRGEPLPGFGGATPDLLVRDGKADQVHAYLDRVMAGGYA